MKKILFSIFICLISIGRVQSQEIQDAVRFAQDNLNGTARFRAMGGAFGALGGDLSAIGLNPAGSAVFSNNQFGISFSLFNTKNNSNYFGTNTTATESSFEMNQTGAVFVFKNRNTKQALSKITFAINYDSNNDFDNSIFSAGRNRTNSVDRYFLSYAQGVPLNVLQDYYYSDLGHGTQQAYLGYWGYVINPTAPLDPYNTDYVSNVTPGGNYYQENSINSNGYNGKLAFNFATSIKDRFYIGTNLNWHFTNYYQATSFYESNNNPLGTNSTVTNLLFENYLYTYGSGFSFQIGGIAKVTDALRLGFTYDTPVWYDLYDEFSQQISTNRSNVFGENQGASAGSDAINYYAPYELSTPNKYTGSFAYLFGKKGLISLDYTFKNYGETHFQPENDPYFRSVNTEMRNVLSASNEVRIGGEYRIKALSLRGGYRFEESPYKDKRTIGDLYSISGGLGYNFGAFKTDFSYTYTERNSQQSFFSQGFTDSATINARNNNFTWTVLFEM